MAAFGVGVLGGGVVLHLGDGASIRHDRVPRRGMAVGQALRTVKSGPLNRWKCEKLGKEGV